MSAFAQLPGGSLTFIFLYDNIKLNNCQVINYHVDLCNLIYLIILAITSALVYNICNCLKGWFL